MVGPKIIHRVNIFLEATIIKLAHIKAATITKVAHLKEATIIKVAQINEATITKVAHIKEVTIIKVAQTRATIIEQVWIKVTNGDKPTTNHCTAVWVIIEPVTTSFRVSSRGQITDNSRSTVGINPV